MYTVDLGEIDGDRLRRAMARAGIGSAIVVRERERIFASRHAPVRLIVIAEITVGLDAADRADLAGLLREAVTATDDEAAWRPMIRARRLLERAQIVAARGRT